jgi:hypothetical protein
MDESVIDGPAAVADMDNYHRLLNDEKLLSLKFAELLKSLTVEQAISEIDDPGAYLRAVAYDHARVNQMEAARQGRPAPAPGNEQEAGMVGPKGVHSLAPEIPGAAAPGSKAKSAPPGRTSEQKQQAREELKEAENKIRKLSQGTLPGISKEEVTQISDIAKYLKKHL